MKNSLISGSDVDVKKSFSRILFVAERCAFRYFARREVVTEEYSYGDNKGFLIKDLFSSQLVFLRLTEFTFALKVDACIADA